MTTKTLQAKVLVLGSGPGGYSAAFRAADLLGEGVVLVERYPTLGGVCLNVGCIPSKALLHIARVLDETQSLQKHGVSFGKPTIDIDKIRHFKDGVIKKLTQGLNQLAKQRKVTVITGVGEFLDPHTLQVTGTETTHITFESCIIAVGSKIIRLPFLPNDPRILDSTSALTLPTIPKRLLVIGGGIIGMEMATVYNALGSKVTVVELTDTLLAGADKDLTQPLLKYVKPRYENIFLSTKVTQVEAKPDGLWVTFAGDNAPAKPECYDYVLSAVGRAPNGKDIGASKAGVLVDERGFIPADTQCRTNVAHIFAIGDVAGNPMLAHKAVPEGRLAAEVISGKKHFFTPACIPSVAYTDPEVAWTGLTEAQAVAQNIPYEKVVFPWAASGRAIGVGREEGLTKLLFNKETHRILGAGIVGVNAGELISEISLAIEMGCEAEDISLTIHPHPTLSESIMMGTEMFEGSITDLYLKK
jgi:dihydrolipoamide dehydrogenase